MIVPASRSLVVVTAGLSQPSSTRLLADRLSVATDRHLRDAGIEPEIGVVELRDHAQDLTNHLLTGFPSPKLQAAIDSVLAADGLIAVTPIFSASYSGLFKMFFDVIERDGLAGKPVLIAATGGTARHSLALEHADPAAVRVPERGGRADRRLRRDRGLGPGARRRRRQPRRADRSSRPGAGGRDGRLFLRPGGGGGR